MLNYEHVCVTEISPGISVLTPEKQLVKTQEILFSWNAGNPNSDELDDPLILIFKSCIRFCLLCLQRKVKNDVTMMLFMKS